jgi:hypothetical protein
MPQPDATGIARLLRVARLACLLAAAMALAACGRCGDFLSLSQDQIGACHSDPPPQ